jgi:hypothetical protein
LLAAAAKVNSKTCLRRQQSLCSVPLFDSVVDLRLDRRRPVIVEGVLVLDALVHIGRKADFVVFVTGGTGISLASQLADYRMRRKLPDRADFTIDGYID